MPLLLASLGKGPQEFGQGQIKTGQRHETQIAVPSDRASRLRGYAASPGVRHARHRRLHTIIMLIRAASASLIRGAVFAAIVSCLCRREPPRTASPLQLGRMILASLQTASPARPLTAQRGAGP